MRLPLARAPLRTSPSRALVAAAPRTFASSSRRAAPASSSSSSGSGSSGGSAAPSSSAAADAARARKRAQTKQREWTLVGASGVFAAAGAWYLFAERDQSPKAAPAMDSGSAASAVAPVSFEIPVRVAGGYESRTITALTQRAADARLRAHETSTTVGRAACVVRRYDTNVVNSNDPVEDRHAAAVVMRDAELQAADNKGDLAFFAVMDGHAGWATSELLKHTLIPSVAAELDAVFRASGEYAALAQSKAALPTKAWRALFGSPSGAPTDRLEADPAIVARALSKAFVALDSSITETPVALMKQYEAARIAATASGHGAELGPQAAPKPGSFASILPSSARGLSPEAERAAALRRQGYEALLPAMSGACALLTYVDSARGDVYVACTGDSRAVAGWWDDKAKRWDVEALSEDQMGRSEKEVTRMRKEHPAEERDAVIQRGRVLGGLEPTRAFGDARYKWTRELQSQLHSSLIPGGEYTMRPPPRDLLTPPYVTARPEVTWRRTAGKDGRQLRWIVMATDGLWDMLSTQEVGNLVSAHLDGTRGTFSATALQARLAGAATAQQQDGEAAPQQQPVQAEDRSHPLRARRENQYTFEDGNLATHLIRNSLGGADRDRLTSFLALPAPESRRFRDDVTVSVILFNGADSADAAAADTSSAAAAPKAKL